MSIQAPAPGIYKDVPFDVYLSWEALSNSRLNTARESLLHFKEAEPIESTPAMRLGSFIHCGVLEPLAISERYAVMPAFEMDPENKTDKGKPSQSKATSWYETRVDTFMRENPGKQIVSERDYRNLLCIAKRLRSNERCRKYINRADTEVSIVWKDSETELTCKARFDSVIPGSVIADLKTTNDLIKFPSAIANYGYHRQGAHYRSGWLHLTGEILPFALIAVENSSPFAVAAAPLSDDALELGELEVAKTLRAIAEAQDKGEWPGPVEPRSWCLPTWYGANDPIQFTMNGQLVTL